MPRRGAERAPADCRSEGEGERRVARRSHRHLAPGRVDGVRVESRGLSCAGQRRGEPRCRTRGGGKGATGVRCGVVEDDTSPYAASMKCAPLTGSNLDVRSDPLRPEARRDHPRGAAVRGREGRTLGRPNPAGTCPVGGCAGVRNGARGPERGRTNGARGSQRAGPSAGGSAPGVAARRGGGQRRRARVRRRRVRGRRVGPPAAASSCRSGQRASASSASTARAAALRVATSDGRLRGS